ncbi:unnamed protein product [Ilex paraguariensis]|uniref:Uncharacterized protein n=1 Tax=Ilex paraguariensis TaxID=185542 RepID=A0ABC8U088_9AQUA
MLKRARQVSQYMGVIVDRFGATAWPTRRLMPRPKASSRWGKNKENVIGDQMTDLQLDWEDEWPLVGARKDQRW